MSAFENNPNEQVLTQRAAAGHTNHLSGKISFLSNEGERLSGNGHEDARGTNIAEVIDPEFTEHLGRQILRDAKAGVGTVYEVDIIAEDGSRMALEVSTRIVRCYGGRVEVQWIAVPSIIRNQFSFSTESRSQDLDREVA